MSRKLNSVPTDPASSPAPPPPGASGQGQVFDLSRRGYDRDQVDEHMRTLLANLAATHKAHQYEHNRANRAESDLQSARHELGQARAQLEQAGPGGYGDGQQSFGYRVERLMRTAEQEAGEVRSSAAREATAMLEQAREQAEAHRHEVEQSLIARTSTLEQDAARRGVALDERERQIAEQAAAAQLEGDRVLADARAHADQLRDDAQTRAELERIKAEKAIRVRQESAEHELVRLHAMHDEVRGQLARLLTSLAGEFDEQLPAGVVRARELEAGRAVPRPTPRPTLRGTGPLRSIDGEGGGQPRDTHGGTYEHEFAQRG